jgi:hypothetical protein
MCVRVRARVRVGLPGREQVCTGMYVCVHDTPGGGL